MKCETRDFKTDQQRERQRSKSKRKRKREGDSYTGRYVCMLLRYGQTYDLGIQYIIGVLVLVLGVCFIESLLSTPLKLTSSHDTANRYTTHTQRHRHTHTYIHLQYISPNTHTYIYMYGIQNIYIFTIFFYQIYGTSIQWAFVYYIYQIASGQHTYRHRYKHQQQQQQDDRAVCTRERDRARNDGEGGQDNQLGQTNYMLPKCYHVHMLSTFSRLHVNVSQLSSSFLPPPLLSTQRQSYPAGDTHVNVLLRKSLVCAICLACICVCVYLSWPDWFLHTHTPTQHTHTHTKQLDIVTFVDKLFF